MKINKEKLSMKKGMIKISILFGFIFMITSCAKKEITDYFINAKDEYWMAYTFDSSGPLSIRYQFYENNKYDRIFVDEDGTKKPLLSEGDLIFDVGDWQVSADSILSWDGHKYDIVVCTDQFILLLHGKEQKRTFLVKDKLMEDAKTTQYYFEKRQKYPEKYQ
ncbi:hypothetical protein ACKUSY_06170 [Myroides odoratus]